MKQYPKPIPVPVKILLVGFLIALNTGFITVFGSEPELPKEKAIEIAMKRFAKQSDWSDRAVCKAKRTDDTWSVLFMRPEGENPEFRIYRVSDHGVAKAIKGGS